MLIIREIEWRDEKECMGTTFCTFCSIFFFFCKSKNALKTVYELKNMYNYFRTFITDGGTFKNDTIPVMNALNGDFALKVEKIKYSTILSAFHSSFLTEKQRKRK